jgi:uncharacterized membrane protein
MVLWGAICGAALAALWPGYAGDLRILVGLALGGLAGWGLQRAVRREIRTALAGRITAPREAPAQAPAAEEFQAAMPQPEPATAREVLPAAAPPAAPAAQGAPLAAPPPQPPDLVTIAWTRVRAWLFGGNTVVRMGVLVLFVGLAFLAKYAIDNALLPPELRLAAIGVAGIALFAAGFRLRSRSPGKLAYALTLQGAGVAVLYLTVFAAFRLYQFLPAGAAFAALGLVCAFAAVIAVAQNAPAMAFIGFAGGFAAPILVSTGQGNHVGLFSYYLLLGVAIAVLAWVKAWRALNLLGFFATFAVATVWGVLQYRPENFDTAEPFLIAFFGVYLLASLLYALRHSLAPKRAIDATLVFGNPIIAFGLQAGLMREYEYGAAFSALALGALYLALGWWMMRGARAGAEVRRWLAECFAALGLGLVTLAVPLALDAHWTSAVWAIEGAGVFWMGRRQGRWLARAAGLALQVLAGAAFLASHARHVPSPWPVAHPAFIGALMLAVAALGIAWWSREPARTEEHDHRFAGAFAGFERGLSPFLFWLGFLWLQYALESEIKRTQLDLHGVALPVFDAAARLNLQLAGWVASAFALHYLALPARRSPWPIAATPAYTVLPVMIVAALSGMATLQHVFQSGGWLAWPLVLVLHGVMLRRLDAGPPRPWWPWVHAGGVWLVVLLGGNLLVFAIGQAKLWQTAWATVILLVSAVLVLLLLSRRAWFVTGTRTAGRWPLDRFARAYLWLAAMPLAVLVAAGCLSVAVYSDGNARPLPYVPLLNPTDLAIALGLGACAMWLARIRASDLAVPLVARNPRWLLALAAIAFVAMNTVWLRMAHHYAAIPWDAGRLFESFLVQAGYSILWTLIALGLMVGSHRRGLRAVWMLGAVLLAVTVLKLFVIDLSNRGGSERIVVFIAVGVLMLVVGYFAPLPPALAQDKALRGAST